MKKLIVILLCGLFIQCSATKYHYIVTVCSYESDEITEMDCNIYYCDSYKVSKNNHKVVLREKGKVVYRVYNPKLTFVCEEEVKMLYFK